MSIIRRFILAVCMSALVIAPAAQAQTATVAASAQARQSSSTVVTASATAEGVRFASPEEGVRMRVEIFSGEGERVFDTDFRLGNVIDLKTAEVPQLLSGGSYLFVVTFRDLRGRTGQRLGTLAAEGGRLSLRATRDAKLSGAQAQAVKSEDEGAVAVLHEGTGAAATVTTHDGSDGQVTSTSGALTLRTGDVFTGQDKEHVRITPEGQVGIGTDKPEATLDVAGTIRARGGIVFEDGSVLSSASGVSRTTALVAETGGVKTPGTTAEASGTGTTGNLVKWVDGPNAVMGNSVMTESGGKLGVGTASPATTLDINGAATFGQTGQGRLKIDASSAGNNVTFSATGGNGYMYFNPSSGFSIFKAPTNTLAQFQVESSGTSAFSGAVRTWNGTTSANAPMLFYTSGQNVSNSQLQAGDIKFYPGLSFDLTTRIGNHSIFFSPSGTGSTVIENGNLKLNGAGSGVVFPDGTKQTSAAASVGGSNTWSGSQVFTTGLSANNALITNVGNPVNAGDAVNKAYADANFVKFVPGAEQLSVGDANGTAPMINLRGGSTCCSGPGGHTPAFFKVFQNGSFVATGNLGIGTSPMEGKGYRTSWHTYKGAFRSGYADNEWDDANVGFFSWAGGSNSTASGLYALAFGDTNSAESTSSIVFGSGNQVKGAAGFSAGAGNRVCDTYGVALGNNAKSGGPLINGRCDPDTFNIRGLAAVAIGYNVTADQDHTTAMGKFASNNGFQGTFIWSDGAAQASADTFRNTANNEFAARATGGFRFRTNLGGTTGCNLPAGSGVFNCTSSRTTKENFLEVKGEDVLSSLRKIPVTSWNYISEGRQVRHLGPMAEDFYKEFGLGTSNASIGVQDLAGVSLAAVKALEERTAELKEKTAEVEQLRSRVSTLEQRLAAIEESLKAKEQK
ncbi:MAG TPA: tail fiber domain-containing protein [Pyrinomonadaceae bacterium]|nr:tail fiber domain-containing protein [Pyrinomonadaceae bacterium]